MGRTPVRVSAHEPGVATPAGSISRSTRRSCGGPAGLRGESRRCAWTTSARPAGAQGADLSRASIYPRPEKRREIVNGFDWFRCPTQRPNPFGEAGDAVFGQGLPPFNPYSPAGKFLSTHDPLLAR